MPNNPVGSVTGGNWFCEDSFPRAAVSSNAHIERANMMTVYKRNGLCGSLVSFMRMPVDFPRMSGFSTVMRVESCKFLGDICQCVGIHSLHKKHGPRLTTYS